VRAQYLRLCGA